MDALSEWLRTARLTGGVFLHAEFSEPWCLSSELKASDCSSFLGDADQIVLYHYVLEGCLTVVDPKGDAHVFLPGQAVVLPRNDKHILKGDDPAASVSALDVAEVGGVGELMVIRHGGGGKQTRIVCGFLGGLGLRQDPLLNTLPAVFRFNGNASKSGQVVKASLELAASEVAGGRLGSEATLVRISELLFIEAVREYIESSDKGGLVEALKDPVVSRAIALLHRNPEEKWTVERLARASGASRTVLGERFNKYLGCAPGQYLTDVRMRVAAHELLIGNQSIQDISEKVGYASEAAFSRAFKRLYQIPPSEWRFRSNADDSACQ